MGAATQTQTAETDEEDMSEHAHKFNGTLVKNKGRCTCGAWATYYQGAYTEVTHPASIKGLESRLARLKDPESSAGAWDGPTFIPFKTGGRSPASSQEREPMFNHDLTTRIKDE